MNDSKNKNLSYNQKKPKKLNTENNIINKNKKEKLSEKKIYKNNYTTNNDGSSSYIKIKINKDKSKENKNNISNYDKRRNYNVPKFRIKKTVENDTKKNNDTTTENNEEIIDSELKQKEKEKNIQNLLEKNNKAYIKSIQKILENSAQTKENKDYILKKKFIEENGENIESDDYENPEENDDNENNNEDDLENNNEHIDNIENIENIEITKNNKNIKDNLKNENINNIAISNNSISNNNNNSSNINNYNFISNNNVNMNLSGSSENQKYKEKRKKKIDSLEYNNKINQFMEDKSSIKKRIKEYLNTNTQNKDSLHDSFRRSATNSAKKEKKENPSQNSSTDSETNFNYNTKANKRSETEIKEYMEKKRRNEKLKEMKESKEKQEKKFNRFLKLNKLNEDIMSNMIKYKNISRIKNDEEKNNKKIPNEFFVGKKDKNPEYSLKRKNSNLSHTTESSQSTVLDQNNYYLDLIMSKNILANNAINNNIIYSNINNEMNNEINSDNNAITTTKDKDIQNTYEVNTNNSNNRLSQEIIKNLGNNNKDIYGELKIKCTEAINRANHLFSDKNMQELINQYKENKNINENSNQNDNNEENNNIIIDKKENENIIIDNNDDKNNIISDINDVNDLNENNNVNKESENITEINKENHNNDLNINLNTNDNKAEEEQIIVKENEEKLNKLIDRKIEEELGPLDLETENKINIPKNKIYEFSPEDLENYSKIFISLEDYIISLIKKNTLNDIISYGETRISYKIGFESLIFMIKSYPYNELKNIYQRQYYKDVLYQFFMPYIRRAFNNINIYAFYLTKFSEVNKAIEQIYRIVFIKRLIFYGQMKEYIKKEFNEKLEEFIEKIKKFYKKILFESLKSNRAQKKIENEIIENNENNENNEINSFSNRKNNTYLYESFSEKSSLTAYPNTEGSARLHKVYELLEMQRKPKNEDNNLSEFTDNISARSIKSVEEKKGKKIFEKIETEEKKEENKINIPYNELKNDLNEPIEQNKIININNNDNNNYKGCVKKIEITNNFKINKNITNTNNDIPIKEEIVNDNNKVDNIDINNNIIKEEINNVEIKNNNNSNIIIESNEKKSRNNNINEIKEKKDEIQLVNNNTNSINNINKTSELIKISEENSNNFSLNLNLSNSFKKPNQEEKDITEINDNLRYPKSSNNNSERNIIENNNIDNKINNIIKNLKENSIKNISDDICNNIIAELILSEIKDKKKLLQKKKKDLNASLNNSSCSIHISQNSMSLGSHSPGRNYPPKKNISQQNSTINNTNDSYPAINTSQTESVLNNSIFMRTVDEIVKEKNLNLYGEKISKKFLEKIENNLDKNYENIIDNLKKPFEIDEAKMINGLMLKDKSLSISSKIRFCNEDILTKNKFLNDKIISDFELTDKEIRTKNNFSKNIKENILYDNFLNKCILDTVNELIEKERKYGIIGSPLSWSIRSKDIDYKYRSNDNFSKKIFINKIMTQLNKILNSKMGLIAENYEYLDMEQLNQDRDKKFMESITQELKDNEPCYQIFETQETYVKLSLSRIILDQLLNEIVEILEHVQYSRKEPDKYQSKSIYACEDIPRLSFQPQTMENNYSGNFEGDVDGDESINQ